MSNEADASRTVRSTLPVRVVECFVAVEATSSSDARVGICALGYDGPERVFDERHALLVSNVGGRIELAALAAALWAARLWPPAEHMVVHLQGEYLTRQVETVLAVLGVSGADRLGSVGLEFACGFEADRTDRPSTPRMDEAIALARRGQVRVCLDCDDLVHKRPEPCGPLGPGA